MFYKYYINSSKQKIIESQCLFHFQYILKQTTVNECIYFIYNKKYIYIFLLLLFIIIIGHSRLLWICSRFVLLISTENITVCGSEMKSGCHSLAFSVSFSQTFVSLQLRVSFF